MNTRLFHHSTVIGTIWAVESDGTLTELFLSDTRPTQTGELSQSALLTETFKQLDAYFSGELKVFSLPIAPKGTPFQHKVWDFLSSIPYGQTRSYKEGAEAVGSPNGFRAVGSACGKNPLPLLIPCHRMLAVGGKIGGFSLGGIEVKQKLLQLEGVLLKA